MDIPPMYQVRIPPTYQVRMGIDRSCLQSTVKTPLSSMSKTIKRSQSQEPQWRQPHQPKYTARAEVDKEGRNHHAKEEWVDRESPDLEAHRGRRGQWLFSSTKYKVMSGCQAGSRPAFKCRPFERQRKDEVTKKIGIWEVKDRSLLLWEVCLSQER